MDFIDLDFLIYSSHKTSTQTIVNTINSNNLRAIHCHSIYNFGLVGYEYIAKDQPVTYETFIQGLINYKNTKGKKLKLISVIRNPKDRLLSSFFQTFSTDEINYKGKDPEDTTISLMNEDELCTLYETLIKEKSLRGFMESIDELSEIFQMDIINSLSKKMDYYFLDHELFELYVLDFNKTIGSDKLNYFNTILETNFDIVIDSNVSSDKQYYSKYKNIKKTVGNKLDDIIESQYNSFYFNSFVM
jgi:hypothetical protein